MSDFFKTGGVRWRHYARPLVRPRSAGCQRLTLSSRLMPRIAAITIYVHDIQEAEGFYTKLLGFKVAERPAPFLVQLEHDGVPLMLCAADRPSTSSYTQDAGTVLGIATDDVTRQAADLRAKGATVLFDEPQEFPVGVFNVVRDPSGNAIELLEFRRTETLSSR